ncbi:DNA topoisomerase IV subunit A [Mycoplasmopsis bovis]|uniref:DNA topoisomerase (ATP-hydrolyzing) n=3 Tax=Mycoplasmopsis bovis TaxID=28903 RepID=A0A2N8U1S5_MYCBV|nr:DNA topoisomerase IV subunit A [Mycoplasmopsis bovis]AEI89897.1 DNA topoisomerase IV subunit A [Mycoplasmopsis bovis Hubei-1]AFM51568.1 topoisomerase IV subunit A [Mycoplasmopsis bovis HB0801]AIA33774.1 DNA topoisomerase IV subunit A [Mycoplasmopsis bovis CQ-W70]AKO50411.1 DNA topoisomerase IV subunit A [Mycoplasmopsis bovis]AMW24879.1 DNA topoisomerase IV subunit A [Mycoplasmopsis bovis]
MNKKKEQQLNDLLSKIVRENLDTVVADRFSRYSKYVIQQRALPDVRDGLKPVQRRILYSMYDLGLQHNKPFKKSARVVGDVIGKYHPHGDSSIYDAMVRMGQEWKMGHTLVEMHGNVGSIDDDPAAAMRYTEARLSEIADYVIGDIKKNTVKFAPNFDDSEKEPVVMPVLIPNLLINGSTGIASGFATEMPPHNLNEILDAAIAKIKNPAIELSKLAKIIQGPDFPTGGVIYGTDGIYEAFERGKGRITLASRYNVYSDNKYKYIEITEIPYGVIKSKLVHEIDLIVDSEEVAGLIEVKDQTDRNGINILITLDKNVNENVIVNYLFLKTQMRIYYNYNNVVIDNHTPKTMGISALLDAYLKHVKDVKVKTIEFDLIKHKARLEIVIGFLKVAKITDKVIEVIRKSEDSKQGVIDNLMSAFDFTLNQATAIAELRLYKLSKTDEHTFMFEKQELEEKIKQCELLLTNPDEFNNYLVSLFRDLKHKFGRIRRTSIEIEQINSSVNQEDLVKEEEVFLGISKFGYIKKVSKKTYESNLITTYGIKEDDNILFYDIASSLDKLLLFTNLGNYAYLPVFKVNESKWKEFGIHLSDFVDLSSGEEIVSVIKVSDFDVTNYVCMFTKKGQGKKVLLKDFDVSRFSKTFVAMKLKNDDELISAKLSNGLKDVLLITKNNFASLYSENDVPIYGLKSNGNKACYLANGDELVSFTVVKPNDSVALVSQSNKVRLINVSEISRVSKQNKGVSIFSKGRLNNAIVQCDPLLDETKLLLVNNQGQAHFEKIQNYVKQASTKFINFDADDIRTISLISNYSSTTNDNEFHSYEKESSDENQLMNKAIETKNSIDLSIDEILSKVDELLKKDKK